ncbi:MAG: hypothetical protein ABI807_07100 [Sporichthyaceae bacterium]
MSRDTQGRAVQGPRHVELYADASRQLPNADPTGRSLLVSCGSALFNLRVAAEHLGFHPRVRALPDDADPTLVAVTEVDHPHPRPSGLDGYHPAISVLSTAHDRPTDWVRAGQALERLLLEATRAGVSASFLNQPSNRTSFAGSSGPRRPASGTRR